MATSAPDFRKTSLRTAVFASRWRHIPIRCPLKTLAATNLREILARTGMFSLAHAILTWPVGASAESFTRLKTSQDRERDIPIIYGLAHRYSNQNAAGPKAPTQEQ